MHRNPTHAPDDNKNKKHLDIVVYIYMRSFYDHVRSNGISMVKLLKLTGCITHHILLHLFSSTLYITNDDHVKSWTRLLQTFISDMYAYALRVKMCFVVIISEHKNK